MDVQIRRALSIPVWLFLVILAAGSFGWLVTSFLVGQLSARATTQMSSAILVGISQSLFLGFTVGIVVAYVTRLVLSEPARERLASTGIRDTIPSRQAAAHDLLRIVRNRNTRQIKIVGISLRDLLTRSNGLGKVWDEICSRLSAEEAQSLASEDRFSVGLFLLDPKSAEGIMRHRFEQEWTEFEGLSQDVPRSVKAVQAKQREIYKHHDPDCLRIRLYHHCPFSFMFASANEIFVEQYLYRDPRRKGTMPVLKYCNGSDQFDELRESVDTIQKHSYAAEYLEYSVGTASCIIEANIRNLFRGHQRAVLGDYQFRCLRGLSDDQEVKILAVTAKYFISGHRSADFLSLASGQQGRRKLKVAIVNPLSQQAILRAIADEGRPGDLQNTLQTWSWEKHIRSSLYLNAIETIEQIMKTGTDKIELRLYSAAIACSLVLTAESAFVEQYVYGKSRHFEQDRALGGEYPVVEFAANNPPTAEFELLNSTFDAIWSSFSVSLDEFNAMRVRERHIFDQNLHLLRNELGIGNGFAES